jgi:hypothetical protein
MKQKIFVASALLLLMAACNLPNTGSPVPPTIAATLAPTNTPASAGPVSTFNNISITIPPGLGTNAVSQTMPASTDPNAPTWEMAPEHVEVTLTGYPLQGKFQQPKIYVYPANEYGQVNIGAAQSIERVRNALTGAPVSVVNMPGVPFFNAAQVFAAQIQTLPFQNGSGVRMVTEYAQFPAPINNYELFYHFQGLTNDGRYYLIAILPITAPILAETNQPDAAVPAGGVPLPAGSAPDEAYYTALTEKLNALPPDSFSPSLTVLDSMIRSIVITNP